MKSGNRVPAKLVRKRDISFIVGAATVGLLAGWVVNATTRPVYESTLEVFVAMRTDAKSSEAYQGGQFVLQRMKSYAAIAASPEVTADAVEKRNLPFTADELARKIRANNPTGTVLIDIAVRDFDPLVAQDAASAVGSALSEAVPRLEGFGEGSGSPVKVTVVQPPSLPTVPVEPRKVVNLALGLLIGAGAGFGALALRSSIDRSIKSGAELESLAQCPVLGDVEFDKDAIRRPLVPVNGARTVRAEQYRSLRTNLRFADLDTLRQAVLVTSSTSLEGKSITACNLAITLACANVNTILLEGDLRRPTIANYMGLEGSVGLTDVLVGRASLDSVLQPWGNDNLPLRVLPGGTLPPNPSELLGSANMAQLLGQLRKQADFVIIDAPPLLAVTDAAILAKAADGALVVVRHGKTPREKLQRAMDALAHVDAKVLGTVLNMVPASGQRRSRYGAYGYGYHNDVVTPEAATAGAKTPEPRAAESADQSV